LNNVSQFAFTHGKTSNSRKMHKALYEPLRAQLGLPSQLTCSLFRQVGATYTGLWTKWHKNQEALRAGYTKKRFKGLDKPPKYVSPTLTYVEGRDYGFKTGNQVSILTLQGRLLVSYHGYSKHVALIQEGAERGSVKLWYDQRNKHFYLLVPLTITMPDPQPTTLTQIVGVDVGQRYLATVTTTTNQTQFYSGKAARAQADHYARLQKRLQRKGTRAATRRKITLAGRERRLKLAINHTISKRIVDTHQEALIGLEELTGIRDRTKRKKKRRKGKKVLPLTPKQRKANRHASKWAFAELQGFLLYKAHLAGSACIKIDADYTSQMCPRCGHTCPENRPDKGLLFACQVCHFTLHADLIGARNISLRTLLVRQDWAKTGKPVSCPRCSGQRSQSCTPLQVCGSAVESGYKLLPFSGVSI
jgi:putative transposase